MSITDHRAGKKGLEYFVEFNNESKWIPEKSITQTQMIVAYWKNLYDSSDNDNMACDNDSSNEYVIENILDDKIIDNIHWYKIKYTGSKKTVWIDKDSFVQKELLSEYTQYKKAQQDKYLSNRTWIYLRTSSQNGEMQISLVDQEKHCIDYANKNDMNIIGLLKDNGVSARDMKHQSSLNIICDAVKSQDNIIIYDTSRFSRNLMQGLDMMKKLKTLSVNVHFVNEKLVITNHSTADETLRFTNGISHAQYLSDVASEKVKSSIVYRKQRGDDLGPIPFGFKRVFQNNRRENVKNEQETKIIDAIIQEAININTLSLFGNMSISSNARSLPKLKKKIKCQNYLKKPEIKRLSSNFF